MIERGEFSEASARARARANDLRIVVFDESGRFLGEAQLREELPTPWWWSSAGYGIRGSAKTFIRAYADLCRAAKKKGKR